MKILASTNSKAVDRLLRPSHSDDRRIAATVGAIVAAVRRRGDVALREYVARLDAFQGDLEISPDEIDEETARVPPRVRAALAAAARNIERVARRQRPRGWTVTLQPGESVEHRDTPLDRVGYYMHSGRYTLPSALLRTAIT